MAFFSVRDGSYYFTEAKIIAQTESECCRFMNFYPPVTNKFQS